MRFEKLQSRYLTFCLMKILIVSALSLLLQLPAVCQSDTTNFGFERTIKGSLLPDDWFQWGSGYVLKIDTTVKASGKNSVLIQPLGDKLPNTFGCVAYSIPARFNAKEIELRARLKFSDVALGNVNLMLRIDGSSGILGFKNMQDQNVHGTKDWTTYVVKLPYPDHAKTIFIGAILSGTGKLWADDFEVLLDGKDIRESEIVPEKKYKADSDTEFDKGSAIAKFKLTETNRRHLEVLCKVWGFLKYYHPAVASGNYNWDYELFRMVPKVLNSKDQADRNAILNKWCRGLEGFEKVIADAPKQKIKIQPDLLWIDQKTLGRDLTSILNDIRVAKRSGEHFYIALAQGVGNPIFKNEKAYYSMNFATRECGCLHSSGIGI
jgi:hypothetical protein